MRLPRLHLGCFDRAVPGWLNTDITPHIWLSRIPLAATLLYRLGKMTDERYDQHRRGLFRQVHYLDVRKRFPYPDGAFDAAFSSHFLEHLFPDEARFCLQEACRVLKSGGICRVAVPDLDRIVSSYNGASPDEFLKRVFELTDPDRKSMKNLHHWHYNEQSLIRLLREVGFREAHRCGYRQGRCPDLQLLDNRPEETLFVEGVK